MKKEAKFLNDVTVDRKVKCTADISQHTSLMYQLGEHSAATSSSPGKRAVPAYAKKWIVRALVDDSTQNPENSHLT